MYAPDLGSNKYGMPAAPLRVIDAAQTGLDNAVTAAHAHKLMDPDNPMLWLLGIGAVTFGLAAVSTSARVGPITAKVSAG